MGTMRRHISINIIVHENVLLVLYLSSFEVSFKVKLRGWKKQI